MAHFPDSTVIDIFAGAGARSAQPGPQLDQHRDQRGGRLQEVLRRLPVQGEDGPEGAAGDDHLLNHGAHHDHHRLLGGVGHGGRVRRLQERRHHPARPGHPDAAKVRNNRCSWLNVFIPVAFTDWCRQSPLSSTWRTTTTFSIWRTRVSRRRRPRPRLS